MLILNGPCKETLNFPVSVVCSHGCSVLVSEWGDCVQLHSVVRCHVDKLGMS